MNEQLVTTLLPILAKRSERGFNVFNVMHHGTHEKQLSNVFAWLLDARETHKCGDAFLHIFLDELNRRLVGRTEAPIAAGVFSVRQEVNTSEPGKPMDIADLVLEDHDTVVTVENYYTSSGHGHGYDRYLEFGKRGGKRSVVVLLCEEENSIVQTDGWENAPVITYATLINRLVRQVQDNGDFKNKYPEQYSFIDQIQRQFVKGGRMDDEGMIDFIDALCKTGEARHFSTQKNEDAAINFGDNLREEGVRRFGEGREWLRRIKRQLRDYGEGALKLQVNAQDEQCVGEVSARYQGSYEWTVNFYRVGDNLPPVFQLKFGPSAWYAIEKGDFKWAASEGRGAPDYTHLFITCNKTIRQSVVSLREVVNGLSPDDTRLRDEVLGFIKEGA